MKFSFCSLCLCFAFSFICLPNLFSKPIKIINRIEGQVYDQNRVAVPDAFVELQNAVGQLLSRTKTNYAGRFSFIGVSSGRFTIKVLPLGKDLLEQEQEIEVNNQNQRSDTVFIDFYLRFDKRASNNLR